MHSDGQGCLRACGQLRSIFFTRGKWCYMSGMIDVLLKSSEDGATGPQFTCLTTVLLVQKYKH
jgi:hypothetical protein